MRLAVRYALGATLALTVFSLWRPAQAPAVVDAIQRNLQASERPSAVFDHNGRSDLPGPTALATLPSKLPERERLSTTPARDFFQPVTVPVKVVVTPPPQEAPAVETPPVPVAPPMTHRFLGRMVSPDGETAVYLVSGRSVAVARKGERLDSGYIVEAVDDTSVRLVYPPLDAHVTLPLPSEASR